MLPTEVLKHEHEIVLKVLQGAEQEAHSIKETGKVNIDRIRKIVDFTRNFTDGCHHAKEEKLLFPKLGEHGFSNNSGPIAVMLMEHVEGRRLTSEIANNAESYTSGDHSASNHLANNLLSYADLLKNHIFKENNMLFNMADQVLSSKDNDELLKAFDKVETEELGEGVHEKYHQMAHEIAEK